jgi:hypothetical protein
LLGSGVAFNAAGALPMYFLKFWQQAGGSIEFWKDGRVVEGTGLENRQGVTLPRGFESHSFRQNLCSLAFAELHYCHLVI